MIYQLFLDPIIMHPRGQALYKPEDIYACAFVMLIFIFYSRCGAYMNQNDR